MKKCKNGHTYDETLYDSCPQCDIENSSETVAFTSNKRFKNRQIEDRYENQPARNNARQRDVYDTPAGIRGDRYRQSPDPYYYQSKGYLDEYFDDENMETVGVYEKLKGFDPVVGWLVCIEGASKGKDFIIRAERNFIGKDPSMDICISGDNTVSSRKHAIISFNPKENIFRVLPGEGHGIVYLNNKEVFNAEKLKMGDVIQVGQTHLMFVPFCDESFSW